MFLTGQPPAHHTHVMAGNAEGYYGVTKVLSVI